MSDRRSGIERRKEGQRRRRARYWEPGIEDMPERRSGKGRRSLGQVLRRGEGRRVGYERRMRPDIRRFVDDVAIGLASGLEDLADATKIVAQVARGRFP